MKRFSFFFVIVLFFSLAFSCSQQNKNEKGILSDEKFINLSTEFSEKLMQLESYEDFRILCIDFLETVELYESSPQFSFSESYGMKQTKEIRNLEKLLKSCVFSNGLDFQKVRAEILSLLFEYEVESSKLYRETNTLISYFMWLLIILTISVAVFAISYIRRKNEIFRMKVENMQQEVIAHSVIQMQENERASISSELHDTIAQDIRAEQLFVTKILSSVPKDEANSEAVKKILLLQKKINVQIRVMIKNLSPHGFEKFPLSNLISDFCRETSELNGIKCSFFMKEGCAIDSETKFDSEAKQHIFRIVQESITNAVKHSKCTEIGVVIRQNSSGKIAIFISDDGAGFDTTREVPKESYGIKGMKSRAKIIGAVLTIDSEIDSGTTVKLEFSEGGGLKTSVKALKLKQFPTLS